MKKRGFTLIELLVVIAIIAMLLAILMPALNKVKKIAQRVVCGTNLKGLGNAMTVYANDFSGQFPCQGQGAAHVWAENTAGWQNPQKDWRTTPGNITVGASLYLLVRLADVSPKSFVCPASDQKEFSGRNGTNYDIVELWDFGTTSSGSGASGSWGAEGPARCVSYSYHQPYMGTASTGSPGRFRADDTRSAAFAILGDKNPWYDPKLTNVVTSFTSLTAYTPETVAPIAGHWETSPTLPTGINLRQAIMVANAQAHEREGQNITFADGHNEFVRTSDVGVKNDNVYTRHNPANTGTNPYHWRRGVPPDNGNPNRNGTDEAPMSGEDSFLVNDFLGSAVR